MGFKIALRKNSGVEADLYLEGEGSLQVQNTEDCHQKVMRYFDELHRLKYLEHIQFQFDGLASEDFDKFQNYARSCQQALRHLRSAFGEVEDSLMGLRHIFANLPNMLQFPSSDRIQVDSSFDAIVVAAGPSLDLEMNLLRELQSKVLIVACDAVLRTLLRNGITPHIVCCIERGEETLPFFENLPDDLSTIFVGQATVQPKLFKIYPGPKTVSLKYGAHYLWLPFDRQHHWIGASVAHLCYRMAASLKAKRIALVGQDLAYHPDTFQSHGEVIAYPQWSEGETLEERTRKNDARLVAGNTRDRVPTNPFWIMFAKEYTQLVADAKVPTVNTSVLGAKIPGIEFRPLQEWAMDVPSSAPLKVSLPSENKFRSDEEAKVRKKIAAAISSLTQLRRSILEMNSKSNQKIYEGLLDHPHFLELVLEILINEYVIAENARFGASFAVQRSAEDKFLSIVAQRLEPILQILSDAQGQLKEV